MDKMIRETVGTDERAKAIISEFTQTKLNVDINHGFLKYMRCNCECGETLGLRWTDGDNEAIVAICGHCGDDDAFTEDVLECTMATISLFRVDLFYRNTGCWNGFYEELEDAKQNMMSTGVEIDEPVDGDYCRITEFKVLELAYEGIEDDEDAMMKLWENGEIVRDIFFEMEKH